MIVFLRWCTTETQHNYHTELQLLGMLGAALHFQVTAGGGCAARSSCCRDSSAPLSISKLPTNNKNHHFYFPATFCIRASTVLLSPPQQTGGTCCPLISLFVKQHCVFTGPPSRAQLSEKVDRAVKTRQAGPNSDKHDRNYPRVSNKIIASTATCL